jgi:hypothetical protein
LLKHDGNCKITAVIQQFVMSSRLQVPPPAIMYLPVADREKMLADVVILDWCSIIEEIFLNSVDAGARKVNIWLVDPFHSDATIR